MVTYGFDPDDTASTEGLWTDEQEAELNARIEERRAQARPNVRRIKPPPGWPEAFPLRGASGAS